MRLFQITLFTIILFSISASAKDAPKSWLVCRSYLSKVFTAKVSQITKKVYGAGLIHNLKNSNGLNQFFANDWRPALWEENQSLIGQMGRLYIWSARQGLWLWEGWRDTYDGIYLNSIRGRLKGYSQLTGDLQWQTTNGQFIQLALKRKAVQFYDLRSQTTEVSASHLGWDTDNVVGPPDGIGLIVTFIPD